MRKVLYLRIRITENMAMGLEYSQENLLFNGNE